MKYVALIFFFLGALTYFFVPKDTNLTGKLPLITSYTTLDHTFNDGGYTCFQFTTVVPDKFQAKTRITC